MKVAIAGAGISGLIIARTLLQFCPHVQPTLFEGQPLPGGQWRYADIPGEPEDIAHATVFLASDQASYITGATLDVNGGRFMG